MKYILLILFSAVLLSCIKKENKSTNNIENSIILMTDINNGIKIDLDIVINPSRMEIDENYLYVSCFQCDTMIYVFALPEITLINSFGRKGNGPDDFLFPVFMNPNNRSISLWGYPNFTKIKKYRIDKCGKWQFDKDFSLQENKAYNQSYIIKDTFFVYNKFPPQLEIEKVNLYDQEERKSIEFTMNKDLEQSFNMNNKGNLCASDNGIAYIYYYKNQIDFFDTNLNLITSKKDFNSKTYIDEKNFMKSQVYYQHSYSGKKYLYALNYNCTLSDVSHSPNVRLEIYDWKGNFISTHNIAPIPDIFVVDEDNSIMYGYSYHTPDSFYSYKLVSL